MSTVDQAQHQLLQNKFDRLVNAASAVRRAMKAYYAYRLANEMDLSRKTELLQESKARERELDQLLAQETKERQTGQQGLF